MEHKILISIGPDNIFLVNPFIPTALKRGQEEICPRALLPSIGARDQNFWEKLLYAKMACTPCWYHGPRISLRGAKNRPTVGQPCMFVRGD